MLFKQPQTTLRFKLFFSYTLVTALAFLLVEVALVTAAVIFLSDQFTITPEEITREIQENWVGVAQPYLDYSPQSVSQLQVALKKFRGFVVMSDSIDLAQDIHLDVQSLQYLTLIFLDGNGNPIDSIPHPDQAPQTKISSAEDYFQGLLEDPRKIYPLLLDEEEQVAIVAAVHDSYSNQLNKKLISSEVMQRLISDVYDGSCRDNCSIYTERSTTYGIVPVTHSNNENFVIGSILWETRLEPWDLLQYREVLRPMLLVLFATLILSAIIGTFFGFLSSRNLVHRLSNLSGVITDWSLGNFSSKIVDQDNDELHTVAVELNQMSEHFESLLLEKQEMSIIRERNRLARDLHDSVKQETFGASAQLAAARSLIASRPDVAVGHMEEANNILDRVRAELTSLIHELYPADLENHTLPESIESFVEDWGNIYPVEVNLHMMSYQGLPRTIEKSFYMILQEAFSNIARHSKASVVDVFLKQNELSVFLMVSDNGCGMNLDSTEMGIGMKSMNERTKLMGGRMDVVSSAQEGTCIRIEVPLEAMK